MTIVLHCCEISCGAAGGVHDVTAVYIRGFPVEVISWDLYYRIAYLEGGGSVDKASSPGRKQLLQLQPTSTSSSRNPMLISQLRLYMWNTFFTIRDGFRLLFSTSIFDDGEPTRHPFGLNISPMGCGQNQGFLRLAQQAIRGNSSEYIRTYV